MRQDRIQLRHRDKRPSPWHTAAWRSGSWPRWLVVGLLAVLAVFCDSAVVNGAGLGSAAESLVAAGPGGAPPHIVECAVDGESLTPSETRGGGAWASHPLTESAWLLGADERPAQTWTAVVTSSPAVRRALLQVFLI